MFFVLVRLRVDVFTYHRLHYHPHLMMIISRHQRSLHHHCKELAVVVVVEAVWVPPVVVVVEAVYHIPVVVVVAVVLAVVLSVDLVLVCPPVTQSQVHKQAKTSLTLVKKVICE